LRVFAQAPDWGIGWAQTPTKPNIFGYSARGTPTNPAIFAPAETCTPTKARFASRARPGAGWQSAGGQGTKSNLRFWQTVAVPERTSFPAMLVTAFYDTPYRVQFAVRLQANCSDAATRY